MPSLAARALSLVVPPFCWGCGARRAASGRAAVPGLPARLRWLEPEPVALARVEPVGAGGLRGPGTGARAGAEVPRRGRAGRADGGADRGRRARRPARRAGRARAGAAAPAPPAAAGLQPGRAARRGARGAHRPARSRTAWSAAARRTRQVGRAAPERLAGPAGAIAVRAGARARRRGPCSSTTWSPPAPRWPRAPQALRRAGARAGHGGRLCAHARAVRVGRNMPLGSARASRRTIAGDTDRDS